MRDSSDLDWDSRSTGNEECIRFSSFQKCTLVRVFRVNEGFIFNCHARHSRRWSEKHSLVRHHRGHGGYTRVGGVEELEERRLC